MLTCNSGNPNIHRVNKNVVGLDFDIESIERERIVNFKPGRVLLAGNWSCEHNIFYCAARRTLEGEEI